MRYRTVVPLQEMIESLTSDAAATLEEVEDDDFMSNADPVDDNYSPPQYITAQVLDWLN
jgi:hypothetical protein